MPERQLLPRPAEQDFLVGHEPAKPDAVDADAVHVASPGAGEFTGGCVRAGRDLRSCPLGRDELGGADGSSGGRIHFVRVVKFDDFHGLEVLGSLGGERRGQHGAEGEVGGDQHAGFRVLREECFQGGEPG